MAKTSSGCEASAQTAVTSSLKASPRSSHAAGAVGVSSGVSSGAASSPSSSSPASSCFFLAFCLFFFSRFFRRFRSSAVRFPFKSPAASAEDSSAILVSKSASTGSAPLTASFLALFGDAFFFGGAAEPSATWSPRACCCALESLGCWSKTFSGFKSVWMMPHLRWRKSSAMQICLHTLRTASMGRPRYSDSRMTLNKFAPSISKIMQT
mmetsp:Transcript_2061/g.6268  ORF Transcript_2061/g.6268 Transcript_2061/m.6268 type:complete len:209 (-) Transcript_2061:676-1302(-)